MANTRGTGDSENRAGWVWVIVGIVAVGLIVWWVAAAVDSGDDEVTTGEMTAVEGTEPGGGEQIFESGDDGLFRQEQQQAARSGEVLGNTPTAQPEIQTDEAREVQQFSQWNERQRSGQVDQQSVSEGMRQLSSAIDAVTNRYIEQPQPGQQTGGGPTRDQSQELQQHQQQLEDAIGELEQAQQDGQGQAFHQAANTAAQTLQIIQRQAGLDDLDQSVEQLQQNVHQIQVEQPLPEQSEQVQAFFDQSAQVVEQISQRLQPAQTGGGPNEQQPQRQGVEQE